MTTNPPTRAYIELPLEELTAATSVEFRQLLRRIRIRSKLTYGQIEVKTGIRRSQVHNLISTSRTTLPSKPDQVTEFVNACGLIPSQADVVMELWNRLDGQRKHKT